MLIYALPMTTTANNELINESTNHSCTIKIYNLDVICFNYQSYD